MPTDCIDETCMPETDSHQKAGVFQQAGFLATSGLTTLVATLPPQAHDQLKSAEARSGRNSDASAATEHMTSGCRIPLLPSPPDKEVEALTQEKAGLAELKFSGEIDSDMEARLKFVMWKLDRISMVAAQPSLNALERIVLAQEQFARDVKELAFHADNLMGNNSAPARKRKGRKR